MKAHEYWSVGALITMLGTFYSGYKGSKSSHKYFAASSLLCMIMARLAFLPQAATALLIVKYTAGSKQVFVTLFQLMPKRGKVNMLYQFWWQLEIVINSV